MTPPRSTCADWLAAHDLTPARLSALLDAPPPDATAPADPPVDGPCRHSGAALWHMVAQALCDALPDIAQDIAQARDQTITEFAPDPDKYPRPFTLHDIGNGQPYVSCRITGRAKDLVRLSHEFGHAVQLVASKGAPMPPALREACAYLAEDLAIAGVRPQDPTLADLANQFRIRGLQRDLGPLTTRLRACLGQPDCIYEYNWNYPVARHLTALLQPGPAPTGPAPTDPARIARLFQGQVTIADLGVGEPL